MSRVLIILALIGATVAFALTGHHGFAIGFAVLTVVSLIL
jgi:hypothetical protein